MNYPEYLSMFGNTGDYKVKVQFKKLDISVADQTMTAVEINNLIDSRTGEFFSKMYFDDHLFSIDKYTIDLIKKCLVISARPLKLDKYR